MMTPKSKTKTKDRRPQNTKTKSTPKHEKEDLKTQKPRPQNTKAKTPKHESKGPKT